MGIKRVSIVGLGALGVMFGHHLNKLLEKEAVRIIADKQRIARYEKEGVYCNGERCDFHYVAPGEEVLPADLLIFAVKFKGLEDAIVAAKGHVGPNTIILSLLNGISSEEIIGNVLGHEKMLYCVAQGMDAVKKQNQLTYANLGMLVFGEKEPGITSEKMKKVATFFEQVKLPYLLDLHMAKRQWGKFMLNVGVNQTVAVYQGTYGTVQKEGKAREMMIGAMKEVIALSELVGVPLSDQDLSYWLDVLSKLNPEGKPSMAQDVEAKRYSEVGLFAETVVRLAKGYQLATPVNEQLLDRIKVLEANY